MNSVRIKFLTIVILILVCTFDTFADRRSIHIPKFGKEMYIPQGEKNSNLERVSTFSEISKYQIFAKSVGRLEITFSNGEIADCTGFIIDKEYLLTAYHCLDFDDVNFPQITPTMVNFFEDDLYQVDENEPRGFEYSVESTPIDYDESLDFAILKISGLPEDVVIAKLSSSSPTRGDEAFIVHHPNGRIKYITRKHCRVRGTRDQSDSGGSSRTVIHKCHTSWGSSGAPIVSDNDDELSVHSIHVGFDKSGRGYVNEGIAVIDILNFSTTLRDIVGYE